MQWRRGIGHTSKLYFGSLERTKKRLANTLGLGGLLAGRRHLRVDREECHDEEELCDKDQQQSNEDDGKGSTDEVEEPCRVEERDIEPPSQLSVATSEKY